MDLSPAHRSLATLAMIHPKAALLSLTCLALSSLAHAQSNQIPGTNVSLGNLGTLAFLAREGTFPNGTNAFSMSTTSCNIGTVGVPFLAAMQSDHPFIHWLLAKENSDRMIQISDRSYTKHAFASANQNNCGTCQPTNGTMLGIDCADTYGTSTNGSRFWLGPSEEIDPWLGDWNPVGSLFDGTPVDGVRDYFGAEPSGLTHRIQVEDSELLEAGATFYYQGGYMIRGEPEATREDNIGWRTFTPAWNGLDWTTGASGNAVPTFGSVLAAWSDSELVSTTNGGDDGRVYVASKVTQAGGLYHYEYALHNRDNNRAIESFRLPISPGTLITSFGFHDIDQDAGNDWTMTVLANEVVFETTTNPLQWNSIFNIWFDASEPPERSTITMAQHFAGPGAASISVTGPAPVGTTVESFCFGDEGYLDGCSMCACGNVAPPGALGGCLNETGTSGQLFSTGVASLGSDSLEFGVLAANPGTFAFLVSGANRLPTMSVNCPPGSGIPAVALDGLRCVGGALRRHGSRALDANGDSIANWGPGLLSAGAFVAGQRREFQVFYRATIATICATGQNTTNAVGITVAP